MTDWLRLLDLARESRGIREDRAAGAQVAARIARLRGELRLLRRTTGPTGTLAPLTSLVARAAMGPVTIGQIGQTLDGRIATETGHSHYINGPAGLDHLHRLRALADAVIVGVETVDTDDPRLTTRRVPGGNPVRIVLDPRGRVPATRHVFDGAAPTIVITGPQPGERFGSSLPGTEVICLPLSADDGRMDRGAVLAALRARGLGTVLVEGGPRTLSLFLEDGLLDRLHIALSPRLFGSGRAAVILPPIARVDDGHRFRMLVYRLGTDLLLDCRPRNGTQGPITRGRADPGDRP